MINASDGKNDVCRNVVRSIFDPTPFKTRETLKICRSGELECLVPYKHWNRINLNSDVDHVVKNDGGGSSSVYTDSNGTTTSGENKVCKKIVKVIRKHNFSEVTNIKCAPNDVLANPPGMRKEGGTFPIISQTLLSPLSTSISVPVTNQTIEELRIIKPVVIANKNLNSNSLQTSQPHLGLNLDDSDVNKVNCERCSYRALHYQQLRNHMINFHKSEILPCLCCPRLFFHDSAREEHYKESHPKCYCHDCGYVTKQSFMMTRHRQSHSEEGRRCLECGKLLKDQYVLKMHVKMVHGPVEETFKCSICQKGFNRKAHLKRHVRTHDEKPHRCPYEDCSYRGFERSDLNKHLLIHNEPKYQCLTCHRFFRHAKNRDLHAKRHIGQKDYKCEVCGFFGYTFTDVRKHIQRRHSGRDFPVHVKCLEVASNEELQMTMAEEAKSQATDDVQKHKEPSDDLETKATSEPLNCNVDGLSPVHRVECFDEEPFSGDGLPMYETQMSENTLDFTDEDC